MMKVGFIGFGWLAQNLLKYAVFKKMDVFYLSRNVLDSDVKGYQFDLQAKVNFEEYGKHLQTSDCIIYTIPPSGLKDYVTQSLKVLAELVQLNPNLRILFCSSISIYGGNELAVDESDLPLPLTENAQKLYEIEHCSIRNNWPVCFLRLGGLVGPNRHPIKQLQGKKYLQNGHHPINLIHVDEIAQLIIQYIQTKQSVQKINLANPSEMPKAQYYKQFALKHGYIEPSYEQSDKKGKKVYSLYTKGRIFNIKYSSPLDYTF